MCLFKAWTCVVDERFLREFGYDITGRTEITDLRYF